MDVPSTEEEVDAVGVGGENLNVGDVGFGFGWDWEREEGNQREDMMIEEER